MSAITYRANLSSRMYPFISTYQGRTVIVPGPDNTFNRQVSSSTDSDRDVGIPQLYYGHNFLPTAQGFQSVDYVQKADALDVFSNITAVTTRVVPWYQQGVLGNVLAKGIGGASTVYAKKATDTAWTFVYSVPDAGGLPGINKFSSANINGQTYYRKYDTFPSIPFTAQKLFIINSAYAAVDQALTSPPTTYHGVCGVAGYMILWNYTSVFWSSAVDPLDFTPSLITGAGGGSVQQVKGNIQYVAPAGFGAVIYTDTNAVAMIYTGNKSYPFAFQEIKGSGGYIGDELIAYDANSQNQVAITTRGLQSFSATIATQILPELSDFLVSKYYETFDDALNTFTRTVLTNVVSKKLVLVNDRFLIVSYGPDATKFTYATVYDLVLKRFGKFKIDHVECFELVSPNPSLDDTLFTGIAFLGSDGVTRGVRLFHGAAVNGATLILGKYQYVRARKLGLDKVFLENVESGNTLTCWNLYAQDGKSYLLQQGVLLSDDAVGQLIYGFQMNDATNHSILLKGPVNLSSMVLDFHTTGRL